MLTGFFDKLNCTMQVKKSSHTQRYEKQNIQKIFRGDFIVRII